MRNYVRVADYPNKLVCDIDYFCERFTAIPVITMALLGYEGFAVTLLLASIAAQIAVLTIRHFNDCYNYYGTREDLRELVRSAAASTPDERPGP